MTTAIVTEKHNTVVVKEPTSNIIVSGVMGPPGRATISGLEDIDLTTVVDGSILVYSSAIQKWKSTTTLENQSMNGGAF